MYLEPDAARPGEEVYAASVVLVQVSEQLVHALWGPVAEQVSIHLSPCEHSSSVIISLLPPLFRPGCISASIESVDTDHMLAPGAHHMKCC